jgi:hypothetical protein
MKKGVLRKERRGSIDGWLYPPAARKKVVSCPQRGLGVGVLGYYGMECDLS